MSPEYAVDGLFSVKSDVFSFGVLVLEIVCGSRNRGFFHKDHLHNLLGHVSNVILIIINTFPFSFIIKGLRLTAATGLIKIV